MSVSHKYAQVWTISLLQRIDLKAEKKEEITFF